LVNYEFAALSGLLAEVPDPPKTVLPEKMKNPVFKEQVFDIPLMQAYEYLSDFELKRLWNEDVKDFRYERGKVNRIGTKHICVFEKGQAEFESVTNDFGEGNLVYGEKLLKFPLAREFSFYYILSPIGEKTKIRLEVHYKPLPVIGWLLKPVINMNIKKLIGKFSISFSKLEDVNRIERSTLVDQKS
jgi:hypothetical protein